jgi:hypothetical protein
MRANPWALLLITSPILLLALAATSLAVFRSFRTMQIGMGLGVVISRYETPVLFWMTVALQCLALIAVLVIIGVVCFVSPRFDFI